MKKLIILLALLSTFCHAQSNTCNKGDAKIHTFNAGGDTPIGSVCLDSTGVPYFPNGWKDGIASNASIDASGNLTVNSCTGCSGNVNFSAIHSGTNTIAAMVISTGASLTTSGTGTNTANALKTSTSYSFTGSGSSTALSVTAGAAQAALNITGSSTGVLSTVTISSTAGNSGGALNLQMPTNSTAASALNINGGSQNADQPVTTTTVTWNNAAVQFHGQSHTVTNTASAAGSTLFNFSLGSVNDLSLDANGTLLLGSNSLPGRNDNIGCYQPSPPTTPSLEMAGNFNTPNAEDKGVALLPAWGANGNSGLQICNIGQTYLGVMILSYRNGGGGNQLAGVIVDNSSTTGGFIGFAGNPGFNGMSVALSNAGETNTISVDSTNGSNNASHDGLGIVRAGQFKTPPASNGAFVQDFLRSPVEEITLAPGSVASTNIFFPANSQNRALLCRVTQTLAGTVLVSASVTNLQTSTVYGNEDVGQSLSPANLTAGNTFVFTGMSSSTVAVPDTVSATGGKLNINTNAATVTTGKIKCIAIYTQYTPPTS